MIRDLSKTVIQITLADSGLPEWGKGLEGKTINCGGCHHIGYYVRRYVAKDLYIPDTDNFMWFDESHVKEFIYAES